MRSSIGEKLEEIIEVFDELVDGGYITEWESDFIQDIAADWDPSALSDKQRDVLDRIYEKVVRSPL